VFLFRSTKSWKKVTIFFAYALKLLNAVSSENFACRRFFSKDFYDIVFHVFRNICNIFGDNLTIAPTYLLSKYLSGFGITLFQDKVGIQKSEAGF
jgi:hypothetical protein